MTRKRHIVLFTLGFCAGNFLYQIFFGHHWGVAVDRAVFQAILGGSIAWRVRL